MLFISILTKNKTQTITQNANVGPTGDVPVLAIGMGMLVLLGKFGEHIKNEFLESARAGCFWPGGHTTDHKVREG